MRTLNKCFRAKYKRHSVINRRIKQLKMTLRRKIESQKIETETNHLEKDLNRNVSYQVTAVISLNCL